MSTVQTDYIAITWAVSRGHDTYGYNICRADVRSSDKRYRCLGGGYDMIGTVIGEWLQANYQERLVALRTYMELEPYGSSADYFKAKNLYGYFIDEGDEVNPKVRIDGGCGIESMIRIAEAIGISMSRTYNRKGHTTGYMVTDYGSVEAMRAAGR